jgi:hypothetical protein
MTAFIVIAGVLTVIGGAALILVVPAILVDADDPPSATVPPRSSRWGNRPVDPEVSCPPPGPGRVHQLARAVKVIHSRKVTFDAECACGSKMFALPSTDACLDWVTTHREVESHLDTFAPGGAS